MASRAPATQNIEEKIHQDFKPYSILTYVTLLIIPLGFIITLSVASPDDFGMVLLVFLELLFLFGSGAAIYAKRKTNLEAHEFAMQFWIYATTLTSIFILYVLMVIGRLHKDYTFMVAGYPVKIMFQTGRPLKIMVLVYFLPFHLGTLSYLIWRGLVIKKMLNEREQINFSHLKTHSNTTLGTQHDNKIDISNISAMA